MVVGKFFPPPLIKKTYMPKIFAISDTWINRLLEEDPNANVVDNNDHIVQSWNDVVDKDDTVYVLGGFGIADMYHILVRLNGQIHFLANYFNSDESECMSMLKKAVEKTSDVSFKEKIHFDSEQIVVLNELDAVLSYFPLQDWPGKNTGTYCFHGLNDSMNLKEHNITCLGSKWDFSPVDIENVQKNISTFNSKL